MNRVGTLSEHLPIIRQQLQAEGVSTYYVRVRRSYFPISVVTPNLFGYYNLRVGREGNLDGTHMGASDVTPVFMPKNGR